jgi:uncharacterized membrane protein YozB (DUF420 family)
MSMQVELPGSAYLYALAAVSITFVGFSALLMFFRQTFGEKMTRYDSFFTVSFVQTGFIVTAGSLLPSLLALYEFSSRAIWQWSSVIAAFVIFIFVITFPYRRRRATKNSAPLFVWTLLLLQLVAGLYLVANVVGYPKIPGIAPYAVAMTTMLFTSGLAFLLALAKSIQPPTKS